MTDHDIKAIDVVCNLHTAEVVASRPGWTADFYGNKIGVDEDTLEGISPERMLEKMDRAGIQHALLIAPKLGSPGHPANWQLPLEKVAEVVEKHTNRFSGLAGIDPNAGMNGVRELEYAIKELGFVGAQLYPHWFELPPDHARYYPFYAKCVELDVPIQMQVGQCLVYSKGRPLRSVGRPIALDAIACDFPDLKIIGSHMGFPWVEEMISVAYKHPNVYISSDAYAPKYWPPSFVHFINSWGSDKVLFGTDFAVIDMERARSEIEALGLKPDSKKKFLRENAMRVYRVPLNGDPVPDNESKH